MEPASPSTIGAVASPAVAPQHRPRPLAAFLQMLRGSAGDDPARLAAVLAGVRAYQQAPRAAADAPPPMIARAGRARLLGYGGSGPPLVVVPSLINGPEILDLDRERSLMRWLAGAGVAPLLVDWGLPGAADGALDLAGHVEALLLPLLAAVGEPVLLAGYCLGGTLAIAAATVRPPRALALIAAPWRFAGYGPEPRERLGALWDEARPAAARLGLLPMEVLQTVFWRLDQERTLNKFAALARVAHDRDAVAAFVAVEDWANGGAPLTFAAAADLFERFLGEDRPGCGAWRVAGVDVDPARLAVPMLEIVSTRDRIVPAATAAGVGAPMLLDIGHVGMVVGRHRQQRLWRPLAAWLRAVT